MQYFSKCFLNQFQLNYIDLCFYIMLLQPVFIIYYTVHYLFHKETFDFSARIKGDLSEPYKQLNS